MHLCIYKCILMTSDSMYFDIVYKYIKKYLDRHLVDSSKYCIRAQQCSKTDAASDPSTEMQVLKYLDDNDKSIQSLKRHSIIFRMFLRYNTALPSSAPVERLFYFTGLTLTRHRNRLSTTTNIISI